MTGGTAGAGGQGLDAARTGMGIPGVAEFVSIWGRALDGATYVPLLPGERSTIVTGLAGRLATELSAEPFDAQRTAGAGYKIGEELVAHGYIAPEALGRTVMLIQTRLGSDLGLVGGEGEARVATLVEALVNGFVTAVRDRILDAQDTVRLAALTALNQVEQQLREGEARFRQFATHDSLTGLPNRTLFTERLIDRLDNASAGSRLAVCCIDLDEFAALNDSLGHHVGDQLLVEAADRLSAVVASSGHLLARLHSDQFAVLIEETTCAETAIKVADQILYALAESFSFEGIELPMAASIGIVEQAAANSSPAELIRSAQSAMHWAKADGKARWCLFEPRRSAKDAARYRLSAAMPAALRRGEFTVHYQPLVALAGGQIVGAEALIRWRHPELGLLGADEFIGLAEGTGLIVTLGGHMLAHACRQAAMWQDLTPNPPYVSVNLAPRHLQQPELVGWVVDVLDRTGLAPHRLQLELTEQMVVDVGGATRALQALADLGVRIALDDFGVGYSNLAGLHTLPVHGIKLDKKFLTWSTLASASSGRSDDFLATTVALGHALGLTVTAEGIETEAQASRMRAAGCDTGQGYYLGRPMPADELTRALMSAA